MSETSPDLTGEQSRETQAAGVGVIDRSFATLGISPKLIAAVIAAVLAQVIADPLLELPAWADYIIQAALTALAAYLAPPGSVGVVTDPASDADERDWEAGYSLVELAVALLMFAVALVVILRIV